MNATYSFRLLTILALIRIGVAEAASGQMASPSPAIQHRIDTLLRHRRKPEPLPVNPPNPFQMVLGIKRASTPDDLASKPAVQDEIASVAAPMVENKSRESGETSEAAVLITCATRLKLGGVIILKDQIQIVVNGVPRKEGDMIALDWNNSMILLRVARLLPGQMILRYGEAEATVKF